MSSFCKASVCLASGPSKLARTYVLWSAKQEGHVGGSRKQVLFDAGAPMAAAKGGKPKPTAAAGGAKGPAAGKPRQPPSAPSAEPRTLTYSLKSKKGGRQLEVAVQIPRSTPDSVLNIDADETGLRVNTGKWGGGYAVDLKWPAPYAGKVRAGKDIEVRYIWRAGKQEHLAFSHSQISSLILVCYGRWKRS